MERFKRALAAAVGTVCAALVAMGVIGNLFLGTVAEPAEQEQTAEPASAVWEEQYTMEQMQTAETILFTESEEQQADRKKQNQQLENQLAELRMNRDSSWQRLQNSMKNLQPEEQNQMQHYAMLQYKEQRLEVLLKAKGILHCLVLLEEQQANILADENILAEQYDQIFDLVQRNTGYQPEQIILIPLKAEENAAG